MFTLLAEGGILFMGTLTLLLLLILALSARVLLALGKEGVDSLGQISNIKSIGLFSLVFGILGQLIGLFSAFGTIAQVGSVSPDMLAAGVRVSMITTIYGVIIFLISHVIWMLLKIRLSKS